jgi:predicted transcriptional regulator
MYISDNAELAENKLTLLYISKSIGLPLTNTRLTQIVNEGNLFNFFLLQHLLEDLISNNYMAKQDNPDGESTYLITVKGSETLDFLIHKLPKGVRRHIDKITNAQTELIRHERDIISYIEPSGSSGFVSVLEIKDSGDLLFSLRYSSGTKKDALAICDKLKEEAETLYARITNDILT